MAALTAGKLIVDRLCVGHAMTSGTLQNSPVPGLVTGQTIQLAVTTGALGKTNLNLAMARATIRRRHDSSIVKPSRLMGVVTSGA